MDIDIKELEAFACVVEKGSFSRAAEALYLTQPTISAHVASLERKLNIKLLVRTTKEIYPSDAGNLLYEYAKEILRLRTNAVQAIKAFSKEMRGTVSVAASTIPGQYYLPKLIQNFRATYPDISFSLQILDSAEVAEQVSARKVEIGFTGTIISLPKCVYQTLAEDRLVIITPNTPPLPGLPLHRISHPTDHPGDLHQPGSRQRHPTGDGKLPQGDGCQPQGHPHRRRGALHGEHQADGQ